MTLGTVNLKGTNISIRDNNAQAENIASDGTRYAKFFGYNTVITFDLQGITPDVKEELRGLRGQRVLLTLDTGEKYYVNAVFGDFQLVKTKLKGYLYNVSVTCAEVGEVS